VYTDVVDGVNVAKPTPRPTPQPSPAPTQKPTAPTSKPIAPTPLPTAPTPLPSAPTPLPSAPTPLPSAPTPLPSAPTPLPSAPTPLPSAPTTTPSAPTTATSPTPGFASYTKCRNCTEAGAGFLWSRNDGCQAADYAPAQGSCATAQRDQGYCPNVTTGCSTACTITRGCWDNTAGTCTSGC
jgi:hypothetical protein